MALTQQTFLGASIRAFNASIGWGGQASTLSVSLVEDDKNNDAFTYPEAGTPVIFQYENWTFGGIIENWSKSNDVSGNPTFEVQITDPRQLMDGVQVIIGDYAGPVYVSNVISPYGYYENLIGFGGAESNETGMIYTKVLSGIDLLLNTPTVYSSPILYKGYQYTVDVSNLVSLPIPADYRISGSFSKSLMEIINELCDIASCEWFATMDSDNVITIYTISRKNLPNSGIIAQFVQSVDGAKAKRIGQEMVFDTTARLVFGGKKRYMYGRTYGGGDDENIETGIDNPIWWYWGLDKDGDAIIGSGVGNRHTFTIDSSRVRIPGVQQSYPTNIGEIRAALGSQQTWEAYLWGNCFNQYYPVANGSRTASYYKIDNRYRFVTSNKTYRHNGVENPQFKRAYDIGLFCPFDGTWAAAFLGLDVNLINTITNNRRLMRIIPGRGTLPSDELFNLVSSFAQNYYGRKIMVRIPDVYVSIDSSGVRKYSGLPVDGGYIDSGTTGISTLTGFPRGTNPLAEAISANLLPAFYLPLVDEQELFTPYVRFDNINFDYSQIPPSDLIINGNSVFVKCQIENDLVFYNYSTGVSPRVVLTLPSPVLERQDSEVEKNILYLNLLSQDMKDKINDDAKFKSLLKRLLSAPNADTFDGPVPSLAMLPAFAAVSLESQTEFYGPWYESGAEGKTEVQQIDTLVPWEYGGYIGLNAAGQAIVSEATAALTWLESGSVEVPGTPSISLGAQLLNSGPYVTDIQVNISDAGVTTLYNMKTWTPRFGKLSQYMQDKIERIAKYSKDIRRDMRHLALEGKT